MIADSGNRTTYENGFNRDMGEMNHDAVNHPLHYCDGGIETIDFIRAKLTAEEFEGYCKGNALKYISRSGKKENAKEDIEKAIVYLGWCADSLQGEAK